MIIGWKTKIFLPVTKKDTGPMLFSEPVCVRCKASHPSLVWGQLGAFLAYFS